MKYIIITILIIILMFSMFMIWLETWYNTRNVYFEEWMSDIVKNISKMKNECLNEKLIKTLENLLINE